MASKIERPGAEAGPSEQSWRDGSEDTSEATIAQAIRCHRLQERHGLNPDRAALLAPLVYGEAAA